MYEVSNDSVNIGGSKEAGGTYDLVCSVGQPVGTVDMLQTPGNYTSGYVVESGFTGGMEVVFDTFSLTSSASAPVSLGYLGGASDVVPGTRIYYQLQYSNSGEAAIYSTAGAIAGGTLSDLLVQAQVPAQVQYDAGSIKLSGSAQTDATDFPATDRCDYVAGSGIVECVVQVTAGATGTITFSGVVK